MPAEFLRDVVGGDRKRTFRFSMLPVSIAAHAVAGLAVLIIPLAAEVEPPPVARIVPSYMAAMPVAPPPPAPAVRPAPAATASVAPTSAPDTIQPDVERAPAAPPGIGVVGGLDDVMDLTRLGTHPLVAPEPLPPPTPVPTEKTLVRPGGVIRAPQRVAGDPPAYPALAKEARVEGLVILEAVINEDGRIDRVRVLRSVALLDEAAIAAVKRWRYTPTLLNGTPVSVLMTITVDFKLRE